MFEVCLHESNESYSPHSHVADLLRLLALCSEFFTLSWPCRSFHPRPWAGLCVGSCHANSIPFGMSHLEVSHLGEDETSFLSLPSSLRFSPLLGRSFISFLVLQSYSFFNLPTPLHFIFLVAPSTYLSLESENVLGAHAWLCAEEWQISLEHFKVHKSNVPFPRMFYFWLRCLYNNNNFISDNIAFTRSTCEKSEWHSRSVWFLQDTCVVWTWSFSQALLSVYDKTDLLDLAKGLAGAGVRLLGSGGTAKKIREAGISIEWVTVPMTLTWW